MSQAVSVLGRARGLQMYADWTDRIGAGEVPPAPPRPQGLERNLVLTMWDWGGPATFAHDELTSDKRNPTANAVRTDLRGGLGERRFPHDRPAGAHGEGAPHSGARPESAAGQGAVDAGAVAVLGRAAVLVRPGDHQSRRDGQQGPDLDVVPVSSLREPAGVLRLASLRGARATAAKLPADPVLRSENAAVHAGGHLFRRPPRPVRERCRRNALRQRSFQRRDRLGPDARARRDRQCRCGAGVVQTLLSTSIRMVASIRKWIARFRPRGSTV